MIRRKNPPDDGCSVSNSGSALCAALVDPSILSPILPFQSAEAVASFFYNNRSPAATVALIWVSDPQFAKYSNFDCFHQSGILVT